MTAVVLRGDARSLPLPDESVDLLITSPPYFGLRSYTDNGQHYAGQIGSEATPAEFLAALVECTREWVRVLKPSGSLFVNLGDKYSGAQQQTHGRQGLEASSDYWRRTDPKRTGIPNKSLMGLPWRYALACTDQLGLILRAEIIWAKPNGLPESVTDRVRRAHEQVFHMTKSPRYYAAVDEIREAHDPDSFRPSKRGRNGLGAGGVLGRDVNLPRSSTGPYDGPNPLGKLPGSVWNIPSAPLTVPPHLGIDHFAAFPPALVRPIVLGWSPPGICTGCGEGRRPVTSAAGTGIRHEPGTSWNAGSLGLKGRVAAARQREIGITTIITGYACACPTPDAPTRPALVVDPFGGTGTTALVAAAYGRTGITIDRSADYSRLAAWRTQDRGEIARAMDVPKPPPVPDGQDSLFAI